MLLIELKFYFNSRNFNIETKELSSQINVQLSFIDVVAHLLYIYF